MKNVELAIEARDKLNEFIQMNGGESRVSTEAIAVSAAGVIRPAFIAELSAKIKAKFPNGRMQSGNSMISVDFCHNGFIWGSLELPGEPFIAVNDWPGVTADQKASIAGNFHASPNFGIFMLGRGSMLAYAPNAFHYEMRKVGERSLPNGTKEPQYAWIALEQLKDVWTIRPNTYPDIGSLEAAFRQKVKHEFGID